MLRDGHAEGLAPVLSSALFFFFSKSSSFLFFLIKFDNIWCTKEDLFNVANFAASVTLAIFAVSCCVQHFPFKLHPRQPQTPSSKVLKHTVMKITRAAALTNDEKLLFSKEAYLPFHLIVMSHFKEGTRLGQHCPVSISFEFKGRA